MRSTIASITILVAVCLATTSALAQPSPPVPQSPATRSIYNRYNTSSITFSWSAVSGALEYWLNVFEAGQSANPKFFGTVSGTSKSVPVTSAWNANVYIWEVRVRTAAGWSAYSSGSYPREFIVDIPPSPPTLSSPADGASVAIGTSQSFSWSAVSGTARYYYRLVRGTDLNATPIVGAELTGASRSTSFDDASYDSGTHTWAVRGIKTTPSGYNQATYESTIGWGSYNTRTINLTQTPPAAPVPQSPATRSIYNRYNTSSVTFSWSAVSGALEYWLNVFEAGQSANPKFFGSVAGTSQAVSVTSAWAPNVYIWEVRVRTSAGWSSYSSVSYPREFVVDIPPSPPTLSSPADGASVAIGTSQSFSWSAVSGTARYYYRLVRGTDLNATPIVGAELTGASRSTSFDDASYDSGTHTWAVRGIKTTPSGYNQATYESTIGWGSYNTRTINLTQTPPAAPVPQSPATRSIYNRYNTSSVTFSWSAVSGALEYWLNVFEAGQSANPKFFGSVAGTSQAVSVASSWAPNVYIWEVKVRTSAGWSSYSSGTYPREFVVDIPPSPPTLSSPADGASLEIGSSQAFTWSTVSGTARYYYRLVRGTDLNATPIVGTELTGTSRNTTFDDVNYDVGTHTWAVRGIKPTPVGYDPTTYENTIGWGAYNTRTIQLAAPQIGVPAPVLPANRSVYSRASTGSITFSWSPVPGALEYWLNVFEAGQSANPKFFGSVSNTSQVVSVTSAWAPNIYVWEVKARTSEGWSAYSSTINPRDFVVDIPAARPALVSPASGSILTIGTGATFNWTASPSAGRYYLRIVKGTDLNATPAYSAEVTGLSQLIFLWNLDFTPGTYTWAVRAIKATPAGYDPVQYEQTMGWGEYNTRTATMVAYAPVPVSIDACTTDEDAYQNGVDDVHLGIQVTNNTAPDISRFAVVIRNQSGYSQTIIDTSMNQTQGTSGFVPLTFTMPNPGYASAYNVEVTYAGVTRTYPSKFSGSLMSIVEMAAARDQVSPCLSHAALCAEGMIAAVPIVGTPGKIVKLGNAVCLYDYNIKNGNYLGAGMASFSGMLTALSFAESGIPWLWLPGALSTSVDCAAAGFELWNANKAMASLPDSALASLRDMMTDLDGDAAFEVFAQGPVTMRLSHDGACTTADSLMLTNTCVAAFTEAGAQWAHVGPGSVPVFAEGATNPNNVMQLVMTATGPGEVEMGVLRRRPDGSYQRLEYETFTVQANGTCRLSLATDKEMLAVIVDEDGDGDVDVVRYPLGVSAAPDETQSIVAYALAAPWPNPFNPQTNIAFALPAEGNVRLEVFDVAGRIVRRLADDQYPAGSHTVTWDGRDDRGLAVGSGIYFCRMSAGTFIDVQRMALLR